jgi:hypothetical protein
MFKKEIITSLGKYLSVLTLICSLIVLSAGCEKKAEKPEGENTMKDTTNMTQPEQQNADTTAMADESMKYPDLTGTWTGTFDSRSTTLRITEQTEDSFKGSMTIAYKQPLNKDISGQIKSDTEVTMKDLTHSRFMGNYSSKLSEDGKKLSGTFTMNSDNSTYKFNFSKK